MTASNGAAPFAQVTWREALGLWWNFNWRLLGIAILYGVATSLIVTPMVGVQPALMYYLGVLGWFPTSIWLMRVVIRRFTGITPSWKTTFGFWLSFLWRICLYAILTGLVAGILVAAFLGKTRDHPEFLIPMWILVYGPIQIATFHQVTRAHSILKAQVGVTPE